MPHPIMPQYYKIHLYVMFFKTNMISALKHLHKYSER